jgi:hypothetical protein
MTENASGFCPQSVVHLAVYYKPHAATPCSAAKPLNRFGILVGGTGFEPVTPAVGKAFQGPRLFSFNV